MLYKTFVRPTMEYCMPIWNPYLAKDIGALESIQRCATKLLPSITSLPYESRLQDFNIYSLYCRQQRGDLIETYKLLHNYYNIIPNTLFTFSHKERTRGHSMKLFYPTVNYSTDRIDASQKFYSGDYNTIHQVAKDKEIMGRDKREDDVFTPKVNTVILEDGEMNEIDRELEEFKRFCLMLKPLKNHPKIAVQVNLKDLAFKKT